MKSFSTLLLIVFGSISPSSAAWVNVTGALAGKASACGNVYCLAAVPNQNKVVIGICGGVGLYATTDNGTSWAQLGSSSGWVDPEEVVFDKDNPNTFWETGIHGGQVHKSADGGATYSILPGVSGGDGMGIDMSDPQRKTIVVGAHESAGLHKSTDGGATWTDITAGTSGWTSFPVVINSQTFIEGSSNGGGIYRTTDGGTSWSKVSSASLNDGGPCIAPNGNIFFVGSGEASLVQSTDQGVTWTSLAKSAASGANWDAPIIMPDGSVVALGAAMLVQCSDGKTWKTIVATLPAASGLTKGSIAYNSVAKAFFMSFWDCNAVVPTNALWKYDYTTATTVPVLQHSPVLASHPMRFAARSGVRVQIHAATYDVHGRLIH